MKAGSFTAEQFYFDHLINLNLNWKKNLQNKSNVGR